MQVHTITDNHIQGTAELKQHIADVVSNALTRFGDRITRVEVHLGDQNSDAKGTGHDYRCAMEARPAGMSPVAVTHNAVTQDQAIGGAVDKLEKAIERAVDRRDDPRGRPSYAG